MDNNETKVFNIPEERKTLWSTVSKPDIVLFFGFVTSLIALFTIKKYNYLIALYIILLFSIGSYNLHCVIHGKCNTWSNIILFMYTLYTTMLIYILIFTKKSIIKNLD